MSPLPANSLRCGAPAPHWPKLTDCIMQGLVQGNLSSKPWPEAGLTRLLASGDIIPKAPTQTP